MTAIGQSNLLQALGWAVFNSLWQMALLWIAYQLIISVLRITRASQKSFLAAFLLFTGFAWFVFTLAAAFISGAGGRAAGFVATRGYAELNGSLATALPVASILYLVLLILPILNFVRNYRYVQVIRRYGLSRADVRWRMFVQEIAARMGIRKPVHIWMSEMVTSPVTIGYIKPVILLPLAAINHLTTSQIEAVLLHELSHIRRYDYLINLLTRLTQTLLYFNPFVKALTRVIEREREKSCDETVIQFQYEPHGYASALLVLEKAAHVSRHSLAVAASDGKKSEFRQRIEWILGIREKQVFSFNKLAGILAALLCFIALNALLILSRSPEAASVPERYTFTHLLSPYEFFKDDDFDKTTNASVAENTAPPVLNRVLSGESQTVIPGLESNLSASLGDIDIEEQEMPSPFAYVSHWQEVIPRLGEVEEKQVQQALVESKKVLQEIQWKEVEYSIADALSSVEKAQAKEEYKKAVDQINWEKMGDNLRLAYDKIDWPGINAELDIALAGIRLDSMQQVYTTTLSSLSNLQKELISINQAAVPDTDITVQLLETKKTELQKAINRIKVIRPKKIVRL